MKRGWRLLRPPPGHRAMSARAAPGADGDTARIAAVIGVTGPPGAPGRTFVAMNLAATLSQLDATVLVDADPMLGTIGTQLDLDPERSLWFLAHEALLRPLDQGLVERHLQASGSLDVLTGLEDPGETGSCTPELVGAVLAVLRRTHGFVVVDLGALLGSFAAAVARQCDGLLWTMVATEIGAVAFDRTLRGRAAAEAAGTAARWEAIVCNRHGSSALPHAVGDLEASYGLPVLGRIPADPAAARQGDMRHRPAVLGSRLGRPFGELAARIGATAPTADRGSDEGWSRRMVTPTAATLAPRP